MTQASLSGRTPLLLQGFATLRIFGWQGQFAFLYLLRFKCHRPCIRAPPNRYPCAPAKERRPSNPRRGLLSSAFLMTHLPAPFTLLPASDPSRRQSGFWMASFYFHRRRSCSHLVGTGRAHFAARGDNIRDLAPLKENRGLSHGLSGMDFPHQI